MRSTSSRHGHLIVETARASLKPIGLTQRGRSRVWFADEGWWLAIVEFQPSAFAKGTYLNVAAMWLWRVRDHFSFDVSERVDGFIPDDEAFGDGVRALAATAAERVTGLRDRFTNLAGAVGYLDSVDTPRANADVGIALGLLDRQAEASAAFDRYLEVPDDRDWAIREREKISVLRDLLSNPSAFHSSVEESIRQCRAGFKVDPFVPRRLA
jgi:hypothetical protein